MAQPHSAGAPEGTRAHPPVRRPVRAAALAAIALLCALFAVAIGDEAATLTVVNGTPRVIDVVVAEQAFSHVAPRARVTYRTSRAATVKATASYAAGQDVAGGCERWFALAPGPTAARGTTVYWSCTTSGTIAAPTSGGGMTWDVTADTLAAR
jgi:hypothetical protein